jgi:hypothetical protein
LLFCFLSFDAQVLPFHQPFDLLQECLAQMFDSLALSSKENKAVIRVRLWC